MSSLLTTVAGLSYVMTLYVKRVSLTGKRELCIQTSNLESHLRKRRDILSSALPIVDIMPRLIHAVFVRSFPLTSFVLDAVKRYDMRPAS